MTLRHRYDEVGWPCSRTTGSPSPWSSWYIFEPSTSTSGTLLSPLGQAVVVPGDGCVPPPGTSDRLVGGQDAEQSVLLVVGSGAEPDRVGSACHGVPGEQGPEPVYFDHAAVGVGEGAEEPAAAWVVGVDGAVAEVTDEQV